MARNTNGAPLAIMVRVHGDFTGRMATRSGSFSNPATNAVIYCSYLMNTSEESIEEEANGGDDSQCNDFISLSRFELLK